MKNKSPGMRALEALERVAYMTVPHDLRPCDLSNDRTRLAYVIERETCCLRLTDALDQLCLSVARFCNEGAHGISGDLGARLSDARALLKLVNQVT